MHDMWTSEHHFQVQKYQIIIPWKTDIRPVYLLKLILIVSINSVYLVPWSTKKMTIFFTISPIFWELQIKKHVPAAQKHVIKFFLRYYASLPFIWHQYRLIFFHLWFKRERIVWKWLFLTRNTWWWWLRNTCLSYFCSRIVSMHQYLSFDTNIDPFC